MPGGILLLNLKLSNLFAELIMQSAKIKYNWYYWEFRDEKKIW